MFPVPDASVPAKEIWKAKGCHFPKESTVELKEATWRCKEERHIGSVKLPNKIEIKNI